MSDYRLEDGKLVAEPFSRCVWCGLPLVNGDCLPCFPRENTPAWASMIEQAVLTAAGNRYPCAVREHRLAGALSFLTLGGRYPVHDQLLDDIRTEFHKIAARYA